MSQLDLELAEELLRKGKYAEAIERLRMLLSNDPDNAEIRGRVAEAYRLTGNAERAFHHFNKAAAIYTRKNEVLGACRMLKAANTVSPNEPDILFRMGECLKLLGNMSELDQVLRQLVAVARASGDRRRAWALDELTSMYPEDLDIAIAHATVLGESGRIVEAIEAWKRVSGRLDQRGVDVAPLLKRAAEIGVDHPEVGVDLAEILLAHRKPRDALALLVPFYDRYPDEVRVLEVLLRALELLGARDKIVPARIELVKARTKLGQRAQAVTEITKLLKEAPMDTQALEVSAHACAAFGIMGEATRLWYQLARLYDGAGDAAGRDRALFACLKVNPNHEAALELGARVLTEARRFDEAASLERRLQEIRRARPEVSGDLPAAPMGQTDSQAPASLPPPPVDDETPYPDGWRDQTGTMLLADEDVLEEMSEFAPDEDTVAPDSESMPIHRNPWTAGLEMERAPSAATRIAPRQAPPSDSFLRGDDVQGLSLPAEQAEHAEETTSRMSELDDAELAALRAEFGSDDQPTWIELDTQGGLTPAGGTPLNAEEFEQRHRTPLPREATVDDKKGSR